MHVLISESSTILSVKNIEKMYNVTALNYHSVLTGVVFLYSNWQNVNYIHDVLTIS